MQVQLLRLPLTPQAAREVLVQVCHLANAKCAGKLEARLASHLKGLVQDCQVDVVPVKGDLAMWGPQPALRLPAELAKVPLDDLLTPPEPPASCPEREVTLNPTIAALICSLLRTCGIGTTLQKPWVGGAVVHSGGKRHPPGA